MLFRYTRYYKEDNEIKEEQILVKARDRIEARMKIKKNYPNTLKYRHDN